MNDFRHISEILCDVMGRILPEHQQQGGKNTPPSAERCFFDVRQGKDINNEN